MPHPDQNLIALRELDDLCWERAEETGEGWVTIGAFQNRHGCTLNYAGRLLKRLQDRGYAERRWFGKGQKRSLLYGVSEEGADRLLAEDEK